MGVGVVGGRMLDLLCLGVDGMVSRVNFSLLWNLGLKLHNAYSLRHRLEAYKLLWLNIVIFMIFCTQTLILCVCVWMSLCVYVYYTARQLIGLR